MKNIFKNSWLLILFVIVGIGFYFSKPHDSQLIECARNHMRTIVPSGSDDSMNNYFKNGGTDATVSYKVTDLIFCKQVEMTIEALGGGHVRSTKRLLDGTVIDETNLSKGGPIITVGYGYLGMFHKVSKEEIDKHRY